MQFHLSRLMGKPTICIGENKDADQLRSNHEADHAFVFATWIVHFLFFLNPKFQASSSFLCLYRLVCVGPVRKPHCWFSHEAAHLLHVHVLLLCYKDSVVMRLYYSIDLLGHTKMSRDARKPVFGVSQPGLKPTCVVTEAS